MRTNRDNKALITSPIWMIIIAVFLVAGGIGFRLSFAKLKGINSSNIGLDKPLKTIPMNIMQWKGRDVAISESVLKAGGADDFLNRFYADSNSQTWANLYVAYTTKPRNMLGHRPEVCYQANGWVHDYTRHIEIKTVSQRNINCMLHHFHKADKGNDERFVLNYYIVNGILTDNEDVFSGISWRMPNIEGLAAKYVAQIQISSVSESAVFSVSRDISDLILTYLPGTLNWEFKN